MRATLSVESGTALTDLLLLERFLHGPELADVEVKRHLGEIPEHEAGGLVEVLVVVFGAGGAGTLLAQAISNWFTSRYNELKLTVETPAGKLEVSTRSRESSAVVLRRIEDLLRAAELTDRPDDPA